MKYDYLIVGAGLFGATFAQQATAAGKRVLVIDKRSHVGGNVYTEEVEGIQVHKYGAHIFHTNDRRVWEYVNRFAEFNRYTNSPMANCSLNTCLFGKASFVSSKTISSIILPLISLRILSVCQLRSCNDSSSKTL